MSRVFVAAKLGTRILYCKLETCFTLFYIISNTPRPKFLSVALILHTCWMQNHCRLCPSASFTCLLTNLHHYLQTSEFGPQTLHVAAMWSGVQENVLMYSRVFRAPFPYLLWWVELKKGCTLASPCYKAGPQWPLTRVITHPKLDGTVPKCRL